MQPRIPAQFIQPLNRRDQMSRFAELVRALVTRELKSRYRRSLLGPLWALLQPLFYMVIFLFIRGVLNLSSDSDIPYAAFTFAALVPWTFLSNAVSWCGPSVLINAAIVKKIALRHEVLPASSVLASLMDFAISSLLLAGLLLYYRIPIGLQLLWVPVLVVMIALLALGVGLLVAALGTYKRDIIFGVPFLMQFWLLVSPIMYSSEKVPEKWQLLYALNPVVGIVESFRNVVLLNQAPDTMLLGLAALGIALIWSISWPVFRHMSQYFADAL